MATAKKNYGAISAHIALAPEAQREEVTNSASPAESVSAGAVAPAVVVRSARSKFEDRVSSFSEAAQANGDLLHIREKFTTQGAISEGRVVRRHKVRNLVVHPQNPRPESGQSDLSELRADWRANGQKEPIHIVPFENGWGIMEGQRRWLVASLEGTDEIDCFEHPEMTPAEVFLFGMSIHRTRRTQTAFDEAVALNRLLEDGMTRAELIDCMAKGGLEYSEVELSRALAINNAHDDVLHHVRAKPAAFSQRHLYALARLCGIDDKKAAEVAESIRYAPEDKPVSAKTVERLLEQVTIDSGKRARTKTVPKTIRSGDKDLGICKGFATGKIEFVPKAPMDVKDSEELHEVISAAIQGFFEKRALG